VSIRRATRADEQLLHELWQEFEAEVPDPLEPEPWEDEWRDTLDDIDGGVVLIAEDDDGPVGYARAEAPRQNAVHVQTVYVRARARRRGLTKAMLAEIARDARAKGVGRVSLDVLTSNAPARAVWHRLGFEELALFMAVRLDALEELLAAPSGASFGSIHVQTDDREKVRREYEKYRPRIAQLAPGVVTEPRNGWVSVYDELLEHEPKLLQRLAKELSFATGSVVAAFTIEQEAVVSYSLYDRGSSVDDYSSVPEFHGPLPPGDVVSLASNPRVVARLTGADPDEVRAVARTSPSPTELPPPRELAAEIGRLMGIEGAAEGFADQV
jgi:ribosomal protein S18 acetylase RimI-like enzyme